VQKNVGDCNYLFPGFIVYLPTMLIVVVAAVIFLVVIRIMCVLVSTEVMVSVISPVFHFTGSERDEGNTD
jgi:hypothetical protein